MLCLSGFELYSRWVPLSVGHILKSDHAFRLVLLSVTVYCTDQGTILAFESVDEILKYGHFEMKATEQYFCLFSVVLFSIMLYKMVLTFESVDEILKSDHSK